MTRAAAMRRDLRGQQGYVMIMLLAAVGVAVLVSAGLSPRELGGTRRDREAESERIVAALARAADEAFRSGGDFPANLPALAASGAAASTDLVLHDPFGNGNWIDYQVVSGVSATLTARGPDRQLGTADDLVAVAASPTPARAAGRNRLRLLRAAFYNSAYMDDPGMTALERALLRGAMRDWWLARRATLHAAPADQPGLQAQMDAAEAVIEGIRAGYPLPPVPSAATGPGGLMQGLGLPDALAVDGHGQTLSTGVVGLVSDGLDGLPATIDDL